MLYRENATEKRKNYLYYNSIAAHPYDGIGNRVKDHCANGFLQGQTVDIYNNMNKWMKKLGEIVT